MKTKILFCVIACLMLLGACYEDKGHYDYDTPNDVKVDWGSVWNPTAYVGEEFRLQPEKLTWTRPQDSTNFKFWWELTNKLDANGNVIVLGTGRELVFTPTEAVRTLVQLCAQDTTNGIITQLGFAFNVKSPYEKGWMILSDENGQSVLSYIRPEYKKENEEEKRVYVPYLDFFKGRQTLGTGPVKLRTLYNSSSLLLVIQESGAVWLNGNSLDKEVFLKDEFVGSGVTGLKVKDFAQRNYAGLVLDESGKIYTRVTSNGSSTPFYSTEFVNFPSEYEGEVIEIDRLLQVESTQYTAMYDKKKNRILWINTDFYKPGRIMKTEKIELDGFLDLNDMGDARLIYCAGYKEVYPNADMVLLYEKDGKIYFQKWRATYNNREDPLYTTIKDGSVIEFSGAQYITENTLFYQLRIRDYLFVAESGAIYYYDLMTKKTTLFYDNFPAGTRIIDFSSNPQESELGVVVETPSGSKFMTFDITTTGLIERNPPIWETNIPGRVLDLEYKYISETDFANRSRYAD